MPQRRLGIILITALVCAFVSSSVAFGDGVAKERTPEKVPAALPFIPTEQLVYEGVFSKFLLRGIKIAELRFTAGRVPVRVDATNSQPSDKVEATAPLLFTSDVESKGWFRKLFGINFRFHVESTVEPSSFAVLRTSKIDEQGKRVRNSEAVFDTTSRKVEWTEWDPNNSGQPPRVVSAALDGTTHDVISAIYFLRTQPLVSGQRFDLSISDSGRVFRVPGVVTAERKKMKTVLGKVQVVRLDVEIFGPGRPIQDSGKMSLWVTADDRRIPVRAKLSHDVGTVEIKLTSVNKTATSTGAQASRLQ
jgi:hypothetical protein